MVRLESPNYFLALSDGLAAFFALGAVFLVLGLAVFGAEVDLATIRWWLLDGGVQNGFSVFPSNAGGRKVCPIYRHEGIRYLRHNR